MHTTEAAIAEAAVRRGAKKKLDRIEEIRDAHALAAKGMDEGEVAEVLMTTQNRVRRMLRSGDHAETGPEEVILRAAVDGSDRHALVRRLSQMQYTFRLYAPDPADGAIPRSWDQVKQAYLTGLLSKEEYLTVANAVVTTTQEDDR